MRSRCVDRIELGEERHVVIVVVVGATREIALGPHRLLIGPDHAAVADEAAAARIRLADHGSIWTDQTNGRDGQINN